MARPGLTQHRKFRRLERALCSHIVARGALETLWDVCYQNGDPFLGDSDDVEAAARWDGEPGKLTQALLDAGGGMEAGFVEEVSGCSGQYQVHDLYHHAPDYVRKRRSREAVRRAKTDPVAASEESRVVSDRSLTGRRQPSLDCQDGVDVTCAPAPAPAPFIKSKALSKPETGFDQATGAEAADVGCLPLQSVEAGATQPVTQEASALSRVWQHYTSKFGKNPKLYTATEKRKRMASARLRDLLRRIETEPKLEKAEHAMKLCIDRMHAQPWRTKTGKVCKDWEHAFVSTERMEYWLDDSNFLQAVNQ
ncbi:MAG TPA: hypothetical protein VL177_16360 [Terriglobales bacterium]|nr:hypothetical protein [Terriglobales bacterium]